MDQRFVVPLKKVLFCVQEGEASSSTIFLKPEDEIFEQVRMSQCLPISSKGRLKSFCIRTIVIRALARVDV